MQANSNQRQLAPICSRSTILISRCRCKANSGLKGGLIQVVLMLMLLSVDASCSNYIMFITDGT